MISTFAIAVVINTLQLLVLRNQLYLDAMFLHLLGGIYYSYLRHVYGAGHFDSYSVPSGQYKVSVSARWIPKKGHFCTVWYPTD